MKVWRRISDEWMGTTGVRLTKAGETLAEHGYMLIGVMDKSKRRLYNKTIDKTTRLETLGVYGVEGEIRIEVDRRVHDKSRVSVNVLVLQPSKFTNEYEFNHRDEVKAMYEAEKLFVNPDEVNIDMMYGIGEKKPYIRSRTYDDRYLDRPEVYEQILKPSMMPIGEYLRTDYSRPNGEATWVKRVLEPAPAMITLRMLRAYHVERMYYTIILDEDDNYRGIFVKKFKAKDEYEGEQKLEHELRNLVLAREEAQAKNNIPKRRLSAGKRLLLFDEAGYYDNGRQHKYSISEFVKPMVYRNRVGIVLASTYYPSQTKHGNRYMAHLQLWRKHGDAAEIVLAAEEGQALEKFLLYAEATWVEFAKSPKSKEFDIVPQRELTPANHKLIYRR